VRVVVGRIGRAHGIRGQVVVAIRTDSPHERFAVGATFTTEPEGAGPLTVRSVHSAGGRWVVGFEGITDRTAAEGLRSMLLQADIDPAELPDELDEWYDHQLVGLRAELTDGTAVGEVTQVLHLYGQDLLAVARPDGGEVLVPFVAAIVPDVDLGAGRVVLDPPGGLLDEVG
jgi:16S rRNA processing protein RimM